MKNNGFSPIPNKILRDTTLSPITKTVYAVLRSFGSGKNAKNCFPSHAKVAEYVPCSRTTVIRSLKTLKQKGYMTWKNTRNSSNRYTFIVCTALRQPGIATDIPRVAPMKQYQEPINKKQQQGKPNLRHGSDKCYIQQDGSIRILCSNRWVNYSGGDDKSFVYGNLIGIDAKKIAVAQSVNLRLSYLKNNPKNDRMGVPTDESDNDSAQELPFDNKTV